MTLSIFRLNVAKLSKVLALKQIHLKQALKQIGIKTNSIRLYNLMTLLAIESY